MLAAFPASIPSLSNAWHHPQRIQRDHGKAKDESCAASRSGACRTYASGSLPVTSAKVTHLRTNDLKYISGPSSPPDPPNVRREAARARGESKAGSDSAVVSISHAGLQRTTTSGRAGRRSTRLPRTPSSNSSSSSGFAARTISTGFGRRTRKALGCCFAGPCTRTRVIL